MTPHRESPVTDLLERGSAWLQEQRHAHMSRAVVYERGADSVALNATVGRTVFEQVDEAAVGIIHRIESRDFLVRRGDLVLAGPMGDDGRLRGIFVFRRIDPERITAQVAEDPAVKAGRLEMELYPWNVPRGSLPPRDAP